jgi:hypothetical protein
VPGNDETYEILFTAVRLKGSSSRKTVMLRHHPNGPSLKLECCEFLRDRDHQTCLLQRDSSGGQSIETTLYCLADMKIDVSLYVCGYVKIALAIAFRYKLVSVFFKLVYGFVDVSNQAAI